MRGTIARIDWLKPTTSGREASVGVRFDAPEKGALEALAELVQLGDSEH